MPATRKFQDLSTQQWNLSVEKEIVRDLALEVAYIGNKPGNGVTLVPENAMMSNSPILTVPAEGGMKPVTIRMVVDLPAPLGPRKPSTSPRSTVKETPFTATFGPNDLLKF